MSYMRSGLFLVKLFQVPGACRAASKKGRIGIGGRDAFQAKLIIRPASLEEQRTELLRVQAGHHPVGPACAKETVWQANLGRNDNGQLLLQQAVTTIVATTC